MLRRGCPVFFHRARLSVIVIVPASQLVAHFVNLGSFYDVRVARAGFPGEPKLDSLEFGIEYGSVEPAWLYSFWSKVD